MAVTPSVAARSREASLCRYDAGLAPGADEPEARRARLRAALRSAEWREAVGAVQTVGKARQRWAVPILIERFENEERQDIYAGIKGNWPFAKMKTTFYGWADPAFPEADKRRFRLKAVLLEALGRLGAHEAAGLVIRTLERGADFYPALVQACLAAARLELTEALPVLDRYAVYPEVNAQRASILAARRIRGEISGTEFEDQIGGF
ncbi:MAG: hypothetical protein BWZ02_00824 [Lentisphaerae bacterium ADurb.BinA184]|nr:MAG: hypothetical protein BWZ02_00824 [Lentisphaerae bacterium ADurb.BinA184]